MLKAKNDHLKEANDALARKYEDEVIESELLLARLQDQSGCVWYLDLGCFFVTPCGAGRYFPWQVLTFPGRGILRIVCQGVHGGLGDQIVRVYPVWGFRGTNLYLIPRKKWSVARFAHTYSDIFFHLSLLKCYNKSDYKPELALVSKNKNFLTIFNKLTNFWYRVCSWWRFTKPVLLQTSHPIRWQTQSLFFL